MDYDWGQSGPGAFIHELSQARGRTVETSRPAAELWMGAHPKAPAQLPDGQPLDEAIRKDPAHFLGADLAERGYLSLPFLFKVLDAARPLSIQAHPDRELAPELHGRDPKNYPDDNHKPELAVCLADMSALIGFRPPTEIARFLKQIPELAGLCTSTGSIYGGKTGLPPLPGEGDADSQAARDFIRSLYSQLMQSSPAEIEEAVQAHRLRLSSLHEEGEAAREDALFLRLAELYGDRDPGVFSVYFLNYIDLLAGEALFLGPNEPHAYLGGRILECMAASDNVVRAGLTSKYMDVATLLRMLHYRSGHPEVRRPIADPSDHRRSSYKVDADDFRVIQLAVGSAALPLPLAGRPAILLALDGAIELTIQASKKSADETVRFPRGSAILLPGDLSERDCRVSIAASAAGRAFLATVGPDF